MVLVKEIINKFHWDNCHDRNSKAKQTFKIYSLVPYQPAHILSGCAKKRGRR